MRGGIAPGNEIPWLKRGSRLKPTPQDRPDRSSRPVGSSPWVIISSALSALSAVKRFSPQRTQREFGYWSFAHWDFLLSWCLCVFVVKTSALSAVKLLTTKTRRHKGGRRNSNRQNPMTKIFVSLCLCGKPFSPQRMQREFGYWSFAHWDFLLSSCLRVFVVANPIPSPQSTQSPRRKACVPLCSLCSLW